MDYLQTVTYNALIQNPELNETYAREFTQGIRAPIDLLKLDFTNRDRVAAELGCTPDEMDAFLMVTKAIWNSGKCEQNTAQSRALTATMEAMTHDN